MLHGEIALLNQHFHADQYNNQCVTPSLWYSHISYYSLNKIWRWPLLLFGTLSRSNWISDCQYFWAVDRHQGTLHLITYVCRGERTVSGEQSARWDAFASCKDLLIHSWWTGCHADATHWQSLKRPWRVLRQWGFMVVIHWKMLSVFCLALWRLLDTFLGCTCTAIQDKQQRQKKKVVEGSKPNCCFKGHSAGLETSVAQCVRKQCGN